MNFAESAATFACERDTLLGIAALPAAPCRRGVLVIVGGPQYRAGSHRQFTLFARRIATAGFPVFRFDYRGTGDSTGEARTYENIDADIRAAIDQFMSMAPALREVVLWGLCGAASAAMMYAPLDARVAGIVALNPWVRTEASIARTLVKHYYPARLLQKEFWVKVLKGRFDFRASLSSLLGNLKGATMDRADSRMDAGLAFQTRMARGLGAFVGPVLLILSGNDLTAAEFLEYTARDPEWTGLLESRRVVRRDFAEADHTFSTHAWRRAVEDATLDWLASW
jgi:exosortase A-associated hydrolase 1